MSDWYVIHTKSAGEPKAEAQLRRQGYEIYLPRLAVARRYRGAWRERVVALFPRYLFLKLNEGCQCLAPIRSTPGVSSVVCFGQQYPTVPDAFVRLLKDREDVSTGLHRLPMPKLPPSGESVRIADGPFEGAEGIFQRESGPDRVVVLLNLLGRCTRVRLPSASLALAAVSP